MTYVIKDEHWQNGSFTVGFSFSNGAAHCDGFRTETVVSDALELKYRILIKHPIDGKFWTMKGMEEPMRQNKIDEVIRKRHNGFLAGKEFIFEVFDKEGNHLFGTRFDAEERIPPDAHKSDRVVFTSYSWTFPFKSEKLQQLAKQALEEHERKIESFKAL